MQATAAAKKLTAAKKLATPQRGPAKTPSPAKKTSNRTAEGGAPAQRRAGTSASGSGERHQNEGHGRRLTMAFEALEAFPALAESRDRLLSVVTRDHVATADVVAAVESDVALSIAVLRLANRANQGR